MKFLQVLIFFTVLQKKNSCKNYTHQVKLFFGNIFFINRDLQVWSITILPFVKLQSQNTNSPY